MVISCIPTLFREIGNYKSLSLAQSQVAGLGFEPKSGCRVYVLSISVLINIEGARQMTDET